MSDIKIIVALHKKYRVAKGDIYYPLSVGAALRNDIGFIGDNTGENISKKNPNYCELTGLYWAWKNLDCDYLGLVHYRRYFARKRTGDKWSRIAGSGDIKNALMKADIILPKKRHYHIETNYSQYAHAHHAIDLDTTREIIKEKYSGYLNAFDKSMKMTKGHKFNMFIMKKCYADAYCEWLFDILFELEKRLDISQYSQNDARVFGFVSEWLLDVWIEANGLKYTEMPVVFMENINWLAKGTSFLKRKFVGR